MNDKATLWHWEYAPHIGNNMIVIRQGRKIVCRMNKPNEGRAERIIRAVNSHDVLVEAVELALLRAEQRWEQTGNHPHHGDEVKYYTEALALTRGDE